MLRTPPHIISVVYFNPQMIFIVVPSETMSTKTPCLLHIETPWRYQIETPYPLQLETPCRYQLETPWLHLIETPWEGKIRLTGISFSHRFLVCLGFLDFPVYSALIGQRRRKAAGGRKMADADWLDSAVCTQKNIPGKFRRTPLPPSLKAAGGR